MHLKIPPVIVLIIFALLMKFADMFAIGQVASIWAVGIMFAVAGLIIILLGVTAFKKAQTTVNPLDPNQSSHIVQTGIYHYTRNPMYLGMALMLAGFAFYLGSALAWLGVLGFCTFIHQFQILPEERILRQKFGDEFIRYCQTTRRWL